MQSIITALQPVEKDIGFHPLQWEGKVKPKVWYRVFDHDRLILREIEIIRETPKGAWLKDDLGKRFVLLTANKRWAVPTIEEAWEAFYYRKVRQRQLITRQLAEVNWALGEYERLRAKSALPTVFPKYTYEEATPCP